MRIRPLQPLIPSCNDEAKKVTCPPYDVLSSSEARDYVSEKGDSFMSVIRAEATLPISTPAYDESIYLAAKKALGNLEALGRLVRADEKTFYVYEQQMGDHVQRGLVVLANVRDYDDGIILQHEKTRPDKEDDRTRLTDVLSANTGPVFLTYEDRKEVDEIVDRHGMKGSLFDVIDEGDGVRHRVWKVDMEDVEGLMNVFENDVKVCYIADGHHRAASAARVARERAGRNGFKEEEEWFLCVLFPQTQLKILAYNRLVLDLNGLTEDEFCDKMRELGELKRVDAVYQVPKVAGTIYIYMKAGWYELIIDGRQKEGEGTSDSLDCSIVQRVILGPILGIRDVRKSDRIRFVGGIRGVKYVKNEVDDGKAALGILLHPVTVKQLMNVADNGEIMPPKSTWFEPKLRSGFFVHTF